MTDPVTEPISDEALAELEAVDVPDWEDNPNRAARAFRMADHVAPLIARLRATEAAVRAVLVDLGEKP